MLCAATWWFVFLYNSNTFVVTFSFIVNVILPKLANYPKLSTQANYYSIFGLKKEIIHWIPCCAREFPDRDFLMQTLLFLNEFLIVAVMWSVVTG